MDNEKIKKILFNEVSLALSIAATTFWLMNYINNPVLQANERMNQIELNIALMQRDIQVISAAHLIYNKNADDRDKAIIEIGNRLERIETILEKR